MCWRCLFLYLKFNQPDRYCNVKTAPHQNMCFSRFPFKIVVFGIRSFVSEGYSIGYGSKMCSHNRNMYLKFNLTDRCSNVKMSPHENLVFSKSTLKSVVFGLQSFVTKGYSLGYGSKMCPSYPYIYLNSHIRVVGYNTQMTPSDTQKTDKNVKNRGIFDFVEAPYEMGPVNRSQIGPISHWTPWLNFWNTHESDSMKPPPLTTSVTWKKRNENCHHKIFLELP